MAEQPLDIPRFEDEPAPRPVRGAGVKTPARALPVTEPQERSRGFLGTIDAWLCVVTGLLLAIGLMMVYSTTFDWSFQEFGSQYTVFFQQLRSLGVGIGVVIVLMLLDYRLWRRFSVLMLLGTVGALVAVLLFGDTVFGSRRALINGAFQPGELAELVIVIYMATWLSSRKTQIRSLTYGLIPFAVLVGIVAALILAQPDISTAATIMVVAGIMFFLAGADLVQIGVAAAFIGVVGVLYITQSGPDYAQDRVSSFLSGASDVTQADYHVRQAIVAFSNGGLTGVGLGQGRQKFGNLPAPHTDSIFAIIGEELGVLGATLVVGLYIAMVVRGLQIARRATDNFGALLASGLTIWIAIKALLNIAVMTGMVPPTGASLPFISFGGSSLVVVMAGVGLLLSISRVKALQTNPRKAGAAVPSPERRSTGANTDSSGGNRRSRLPGAGDSRGAARVTPQR
ncbi:MAG TPA: putative peptidoglycan glycosyltransferase FtsW [Aggregatilineales bacterium]|nr:putative peptidoglycan glycosyltransferase FtsW [Aggregatilineales bacterium]